MGYLRGGRVAAWCLGLVVVVGMTGAVASSADPWDPHRRGSPPGPAAGPRPPASRPPHSPPPSGGASSSGGQAVNQLAEHRVFTATSPDGLTWALDPIPILEKASVPAAVVLSDGTLVLYFVDARRLPSSVNIALSSDGGRSFRRLDTAVPVPEGFVAVDPCPVLLPDGRVRLYYYLFEHGPGLKDPIHSIASAISDDGLAFRSEGVVFRHPGLVDPDVFWDGSAWRMFVMSLADQATVVATSASGDSFTYAGPLSLAGIGTTRPVAVPPEDGGGFRVYGFPQGRGGQTEFWSYRSADAVSWTREPGVRLALPPGMNQMTDPFVVRLPDGTWRMVFKAEPPPRR